MFTLASLPYPIAHFLGYRKPTYKPRILPLWRVCLWSFLGAWVGIIILEVVFACGAQFQIHKTPVIIGSFGASAVLLYGAIDSPLGQPRNAFFGHFFGALVGVIISQLFTQVPKDWVSEGQEHAVMWVAGATAMALTLVVMQVTKTVHPPGGATALIAVVQDTAVAMKWYYIGIVVLSISLQICIATLINNIDRRYPIYWWSPKKFPMTFDPTTASTVIPRPHEVANNEELVVDDSSLTEAERGQMEPKTSNMQSRTSSSSTVLQQIYQPLNEATRLLSKNHFHYVILPEDAPIVLSPTTAQLLTDEERACLDRIHAKLKAAES